MTDFLFYADTVRSAAARHELPLSIGDPFLLVTEDGGETLTQYPYELTPA
jgi:hypothetical protein